MYAKKCLTYRPSNDTLSCSLEVKTVLNNDRTGTKQIIHRQRSNTYSNASSMKLLNKPTESMKNILVSYVSTTSRVYPFKQKNKFHNLSAIDGEISEMYEQYIKSNIETLFLRSVKKGRIHYLYVICIYQINSIIRKS